MNKLGLVIIGRNESDRLHQCFLSALNTVRDIVYVDSGSTDNSVNLARSLGVNLLELDLTIPFTAARARNEGFAYLLKINPDLEFVQFVDGDCQIAPSWLKSAMLIFDLRPEVAVVCGRRREKFPKKSIYNQLCDIEWDTPLGETKACGGDAMMRVRAFKEVGGFDSGLIAGEEPELCVRLRQQQWKILRIQEEMTLHDAQMLRFSQWWNRTMRAGHAYAEGAWLHGKSPEKHWVKESKSIWFWGVALPFSSISTIWLTQGWSLILLIGYPVLIYRIYSNKKHNLASGEALLYALFCAIGKFAQATGQIKFYLIKLQKKQSTLIEYKTLATNIKSN
ncbi:glycosyltransferase [Waterburya agarophytonicola K14]|uniref:Glycosyltransferase n=1 Tax=Waterburya agarophytonicola KI4 TaxID=2874699 RepID=A0A964FGY3_9CYAN|nr:glycosyltransferase [Waterburya agarophytonicola]MCC0178512.1 glycosyltransferase [Waterburya agarophytonicola KI4]